MKTKTTWVKGQSENSDLKKKFENFTYPVNDSNWDAISSRISAGKGSGFLGNKFAEFAVQPSPEVWSNVELAIQQGKKKRPVAYWWYGVAAGLMLFVYLGYETFRPENAIQPVAQEAPISNSEKEAANAEERGEKESGLAGDDTIRVESIPASAKGKSTKENGSKENSAAKMESDPRAATETKVLATENPSKSGEERSKTGGRAVSPGAEKAENNGERFEKDFDKPLAKAEERSDSAVKIPTLKPDFHGFPLIAQLAGEPREFSGLETDTDEASQESQFYNGLEPKASNEISLWAGSQLAFANAGAGSDADSPDFMDVGIGTSESAVSVESRKFSMPIYYGVNGEISFWKRMSAGVGLGYMQLESTTTYFVPNGRRVVTDQENYLSIPLYLKFNFIHKPKFAAYTSLGHAFDIMVGQSQRSEHHQNGQVTELSSAVREEKKENQANVFSSVGIHFKFTKNLGVYGEGTLMHYYSQNRVNFYSQQKFWPGVKFGLLISFD